MAHQDHTTIEAVPNARWAISRPIPNAEGYVSTTFIQNTPVDREEDIFIAFKVLDLDPKDVDHYFPRSERPGPHCGQRCPTLEFMQLWHEQAFKQKKLLAEMFSNDQQLCHSVGV